MFSTIIEDHQKAANNNFNQRKVLSQYLGITPASKSYLKLVSVVRSRRHFWEPLCVACALHRPLLQSFLAQTDLCNLDRELEVEANRIVSQAGTDFGGLDSIRLVGDCLQIQERLAVALSVPCKIIFWDHLIKNMIINKFPRMDYRFLPDIKCQWH